MITFKNFNNVEFNLFMAICSKIRDKGSEEIILNFSELKEMVKYKHRGNARFLKDLEQIYKKLITLIIIVTSIILFLITFINQEKMSKKYDEESSQYTQQIENAQTAQNKLKSTSSSLNTLNYIEDTARNKLDMYLPNERVYVDIDN